MLEQRGNIEVSIIIPVYNVEKYLRKCIESILKQSYINWEIILINDGSTDGSGLICDEYVKAYENIRYINQENRGVSVARNKGLELADGVYIVFVDADDWIEPGYLGKMVGTIQNSGADMAVFGCQKCNPNGIAISSSQEEVDTKLCNQREAFKIIYSLDDERFGWQIGGKIYRHSVICDLRFQEGYGMAEDFGFCYDVLKKVESVAFRHLTGYKYLTRYDSATQQPLNKKYFSGIKMEHEIYMKADKYEKDVIKTLILDTYITNGRRILYDNVVKDFAIELQTTRAAIARNMLYIFKERAFSYRKKVGALLLVTLPNFVWKLIKIIDCDTIEMK